jgi:hypothetical protein
MEHWYNYFPQKVRESIHAMQEMLTSAFEQKKLGGEPVVFCIEQNAHWGYLANEIVAKYPDNLPTEGADIGLFLHFLGDAETANLAISFNPECEEIFEEPVPKGKVRVVIMFDAKATSIISSPEDPKTFH